MEAEVFLAALFRRDIVADGPPRVHWNPVTLGYDLDGPMLRLDPATVTVTVTAASRGAPVA